MQKIRSLDGFDLIMLISEIHDFGWPHARGTLAMMPPGTARNDPTQGADPRRP
jgi:hypothetical protein